MLNSLKNSRFIHAICDQINRLPSPIVALLMIVAIVIGVFVIATLGFATFTICATALMLALTAIPYGLGFGVLGLGVHILFWGEQNKISLDKLTYAYITKQSIKLWSLAAILGIVVLLLYPMGRHFLYESQSFSIHDGVNAKAISGLQIFMFGWLIIAVYKFFKLFNLISDSFKNFGSALSEMGLEAKNKCAELKNRNISF